MDTMPLSDGNSVKSLARSSRDTSSKEMMTWHEVLGVAI